MGTGQGNPAMIPLYDPSLLPVSLCVLYRFGNLICCEAKARAQCTTDTWWTWWQAGGGGIVLYPWPWDPLTAAEVALVL